MDSGLMMSHDVRPLYSVIICSYNQMYSGTGRVIFDWLIYASEYFRFEIVMDATELRNFQIVKQFCEARNFGFVPVRSRPLPGAPDPGLRGLADYISTQHPSIVEIHSWANSATNFAAIEAVGSDVTFVFTPHTQPFWTIPDHQRYYLLRPILRMALERADMVCCLSAAEIEHLTLEFGRQPGYQLIGNGVDTAVFRPSAVQKPVGILSISDFKEKRKRNDLLFKVLEQVINLAPDVQFTIAGRGSEDVVLSEKLWRLTNVLGYVSNEKLVSLYQGAGVFVLLSDFEAFGIPIAEALCCGTPVVINQTSEMTGIFGGLPGVVIVDNRNAEACSEAILTLMSTTDNQRNAIAMAAAERFSFDAVYGQKLRCILSLVPKKANQADSAYGAPPFDSISMGPDWP